MCRIISSDVTEGIPTGILGNEWLYVCMSSMYVCVRAQKTTRCKIFY